MPSMVLYIKHNNKSISLSIYVCVPDELYKAIQSNMKHYTVFTWTYVKWVQPGSSAFVSHGIKDK